MELASLLHDYLPTLKTRYANRLLPGHLRAIGAILRCRTPASGQIRLRCSQCGQTHCQPRSCGHRNCPKCQNHEASLWLDRQRLKLLPVEYFMLTFTLPRQLRSMAWHHQTVMYRLLFSVGISTLKDFGLNPNNLGAELGMTAMLHTHSRRLDYHPHPHPHVHVIVPGGGVDSARRQWKKKKGKYLFNERALAKAFRARFLAAMKDAQLLIPGESKTGATRIRTLKGEDFLWLVLQHVLPKGVRRVREYGFLHGNAKKLLSLV